MFGPKEQFLRYAGVGGTAFAVDLAVLMALVVAGMHYLAANVLAFLVANTANFWLGQRFVFRAGARLTTAYQAYAAVLAISVVGLGVNTGTLAMAVETLGSDLITAKVLAAIAALIWNYWARRAWVYH